MRFCVSHETEYRYSVPVALGPHQFRLNPLPGRGRILMRRLWVEPTPVEQYDETDPFGNVLTRVNFAGECSILRIRSEFEVEPFAPEPIRDESFSPLPWPPADDDLNRYRLQYAADDRVRRFASEICQEVAGWPVAFLDHLNRRIHEGIDRRIRLDGAAQSPAETLDRSSGACRDLAMLFIDTCRCMGLATRFVSGYQGAYDTPDQQRHLHAWAEVFLPRYGWRGWDPMHGARVAEGHIALCAAPDQAGTMPVDGSYSFSGEHITSTLIYTVRIQGR
jgi:transglutaminase-like putative cysteine protease